jgi:hypothetical protein
VRPDCIPKPTKEQWELTALEFERRSNFPALPMGRRWEIYASNETGTQWLDVLQLQRFVYVVLMAVADTNYRFVYVGIGSYGKRL